MKERKVGKTKRKKNNEIRAGINERKKEQVRLSCKEIGGGESEG